MPRSAIQLYTVRDRATPLSGLLRESAVAGFEGVEFASRVRQADPQQVEATLEGVGLRPVGAHLDLEVLLGEPDGLIDLYRDTQCRRVIIPHIGIDRFRTPDRLDALIHELEEAVAKLDSHDMELGIHTTRELLLPYFTPPGITSLLRIDGLPRGAYTHAAWLAAARVPRTSTNLWHRTPIGRIADELPAISFELDAKSVVAAGYEFEAMLSTLADRIPVVHLSDVRRSRWIPPDYRPVYPGDGLVDPPQVQSAARRHDVEWIVSEHDDPPDPEDAIRILSTQVGKDNGAPG